jgi:Mn-containing catalase
VLPFALIALATMAATYYITRGISDIYLLLAAKVVTAAVIYMAMMWVCRAKVLRESIEFLRRRSVRHDR